MPYGLTGWDEADDIRSSLSLAIENFDLDPQLGQERRVCVWCEAGGMVAQLERVAAPYGVHVVSGGGFDSVTDKHGFAQLVTESAEPFTVLHIGDLDQAGESIFTVVSEDVPAFCSTLGGDVVFHRLAITLEQVERYRLPLQPGAPRPIVQAEALPPDALAALVQTAIRERLDLEKLVAVQRRTREVKVATMKALLSVGLGAPA